MTFLRLIKLIYLVLLITTEENLAVIPNITLESGEILHYRLLRRVFDRRMTHTVMQQVRTFAYNQVVRASCAALLITIDTGEPTPKGLNTNYFKKYGIFRSEGFSPSLR